MASTLKSLRTGVENWIEDESEPDVTDRAINDAIDIVTGECTYSQLIETQTSTPDDDGMVYVPARCRDIIDIYPASTSPIAEFVFAGTRRKEVDARMGTACYRSVGGNEEALANVTVDATHLSTTIEQSVASADAFTESMIGEALVIDGYPEEYRIISFDDSGVNPSITVYPSFKWPDADSLSGSVRPAGTEKIQLYNTAGSLYVGDVTIEFSKKHPYLVNDFDPLLVPAPRSVETEAVQFFLRQTKYDVDADRLEVELRKYKAMETSKQPATMERGFRTNDKLFSAPMRGRKANW